MRYSDGEFTKHASNLLKKNTSDSQIISLWLYKHLGSIRNWLCTRTYHPGSPLCTEPGRWLLPTQSGGARASRCPASWDPTFSVMEKQMKRTINRNVYSFVGLLYGCFFILWKPFFHTNITRLQLEKTLYFSLKENLLIKTIWLKTLHLIYVNILAPPTSSQR